MDASPAQLLSRTALTLGYSLLLGVCVAPLGTLAQHVERASAAPAQAPNTSRSTSAPSGAGIGSTIEAFLTAQTRQLEGQVEFDVGAPDPNLSLAPCNVVEPFLPSGARLWGKTRLGLRCTDGARWSITVPLNVRVIGRAWVAARTLAPGQPVSESDFTEAEVELTNEPGAPLRPGSNLEFRALTRTVTPGTVIREDWLRALPVVVQGEIVKMTIRGNGFSISADGVALNNAVEGAQVRIRTENGRTVSGTARPGKVAEIRL